MYIQPEVVDEIQHSVPIEDVIRMTGFQIKGEGKSKSVDHCPKCARDYTHIKINPTRNLFNCFSPNCQFQGNQFQWIMEVEGLTFPDAVQRVANIGQLNISFSDNISGHEKRKQSALQAALAFYQTQDSNYLSSRGISEETQRIYECGYAPGGVTLKKYLNKEGFGDDFLLEIGLVRQVKNRVMDRFFNSVIIPDIRNGWIYDFYARYTGDDYNTKHMYLYGDRSLLGSHTAADNEQCVFVEAPIDALSAFELFQAPSISVGGASKFSDWHAHQIMKRQLKPILAYDGDEAGIEATVTTIDILKNRGKSVLALKNPKKDLNKCLIDGLNKNDFNGLFLPGSHFLWNYQLDQIPMDFIRKYMQRKECVKL